MAIVAGVSFMAAAKCFGFSSVKVSQTEIEFFAGTQIVNTTNNDVTPINQQYSNRRPVENRSGDDWVIASCQSPDEHAISGLCVINDENDWGWVLQNAGIMNENKAWGCAYRHGVYVEVVNGTPGTKFRIIPPFNPPNNSNDLKNWQTWRSGILADVRAAAPTASATATVLCINDVKPVKEDCSCWKRLFN